MSNSLNFLNKPPTPAKTYGPQPKPGSATTAAPKPFIDSANPWAVGGWKPAGYVRRMAAAPPRPTPNVRRQWYRS
ncbi:MAG: hypothetical protein KAX65_12210 [Caldilineaceae bacterium]|nr:hypothetical protein [Caldilineaceae bacterium]